MGSNYLRTRHYKVGDRRVNVLVIGSFMMDLVVRTPRAPQDGETIIGTSFSRSPGGKGANQAVSVARLGGNVTLIGQLGNDRFGEEMLTTLEENNIDTQYILRDANNSTGVGLITLEENGHNRIIVVPGANGTFKSDDLNNVIPLLKKADILLVQLEMDLKVIEQAISYAHDFNIPIILNPAPARELDEEILKQVTYLTPNETEAEILTGIKVKTKEDAEKAAKILLNKGVENIVITLGDKGSLVASQNEITYIAGYSVTTVNSVAAGDAFNGALAFSIVNGKSLNEAVRFANAVGALAVTKEGAIPALPYISEVEQFLNTYKNGIV